MALSVNSPGPAFDPARPTKSFRESAPPFDALNRLPQLYREAGHNLALSQFLARSPSACMVLMLAGSAALLAAGGGATLKAGFAWAALLLLGIVAMTRNFIRGYARSLRRVPLEEAAADLRALLLYTGVVWGAGAFLVMPDVPAPALVFSFAAVPSLMLALMLGDAKAAMAFALPASLITAGAALLGAWPLAGWVAGSIMAVCAALILLMLRRVTWPSEQ